MTATFREDRQWWFVNFTITLPDGTKQYVREKSPINSRAGAEDHERARRIELVKPAKAPVSPTFAGFAPSFLTFAANNTRGSTHEETVSVMTHHLVPFFGADRLDEITSERIEEYKNTAKSVRYNKALTRKTINNHLIILSRVLHIAHEWGKLQKLPTIRMFPGLSAGDRSFTYLEFEEADRFIEAAGGEDWSAMITVAIHTGLRVGELLALRWTDIDLVVGRLVVRQRLWRGNLGPPKSGKNREIPLSNTARATLQSTRHLRGPYVFCNEDGSLLTYSKANHGIAGVSRRAGLGKPITWHDLRHTFASHLVMKGVPLRIVQELLGHATLEMTLRYSHLAPAVKAEAVKMLDKVGT